MSKNTFEFQPTLLGPRVTIRPIVAADWAEMFAAAQDPAIWLLHPEPDRHLEAKFRGYFDDAIRCGSAFTFVDQQNGAIIGSSRYNDYDRDASEIEIGWTFLTRAYWGGSYNAEIKALMLNHAFRFVDTVLFWVGVRNLRSRRAVEKIGGVPRAGDWSRTHGGRAEPYVLYEIARPGRGVE